MKSRGLSALLIQHVHGPETLARGTPRLHSLRSLPEAQGSATPPFTLSVRASHSRGSYTEGSPTCRLPRTGSLPVLFPQSGHNLPAEYVTGLMQLNSNVCV